MVGYINKSLVNEQIKRAEKSALINSFASILIIAAISPRLRVFNFFVRKYAIISESYSSLKFTRPIARTKSTPSFANSSKEFHNSYCCTF